MVEVQKKITQNPFNNIKALFSNWLNKLKGKKSVVKESGENQSQPQDEVEIKPEDIKKEGIVTKSVQQFKGVVAKGSKKLPTGKKGLPKPLIVAVIVVVILLIISLIASKLAPSIKRDGKKEGETLKPTPTPVDFIKYKPSVYAGDPKVLALEEEINILDGEVRSIILKDDTLKPPTVDFNINFK